MFWHRFCLFYNEYINWELKMNNILKKLKKVNGQSLAEFAVTTAMMATLATTAAPKFSGVGEGAKEKKTMSDIDKILKACELNNPENYKYDKSITKKIFNYKKNYDRLRIAAGKNITPKIYKALKANPNISFDGLPLRVDYNIDGSISLGQKNTENPEAWIVQVKKVFMEKKVKKNYQIVNKLI